MKFLTDDPDKFKAALKAQELSLLRKKRLALVAQRKHQSDETKIDTIKTFLALGGNLKLTSGATGIPYPTLKGWKATQWWNDVVTELRKAEKLELSVSTKTILNKSLALIEDRLNNGDFIYDQKKGKLIRKPLQAKDLHKIAVDMMDRKDKLDKATASDEVHESHDEKLKSLAERFAALAIKAVEKQSKIDSDVVLDIPFKDVTNIGVP
jgi:hypothetical protein